MKPLFWLLMLSLMIGGCGGAGVPQDTPSPVAHTLAVGENAHLNYQLPAEWSAAPTDRGYLWVKEKSGRLHVFDAGAVPSGQTEGGLKVQVEEYFRGASRSGEARALTRFEEVRREPLVALVTYRTAYGPGNALFLVCDGHLVTLDMSTPLNREEQGREVLRELAASLEPGEGFPRQVERKPDPISHSARPSLLQQQQAQREKERKGKQEQEKLKGLAPLIPIGILLLFTAFPAYAGATLGYKAAEATDGDVRAGAASSAFWFTAAGVFAGVVLASVVLFFVFAAAPSGSGVMTPMTAWGFLTIVMVLFGLMAALVGGALAAVGAWVGAARGLRASALTAALLGLAGVLVGPVLLRYMPVKKKPYRSHTPRIAMSRPADPILETSSLQIVNSVG